MAKKTSARSAEPTIERGYTVAEIAEIENCSEKTIRRAIAAGEIDVYRIGLGRHIRITASAHAAYRARHGR
ncbi:MAG: DNA-binding protein [Hyphomicrobiales bacterium]|nr:MAG: DNA-binding protein [Hyphomicrobiales bacterium]